MNGQKKIRVIVGDDHGLVREGFLLLLGRDPEIEVVASVASGDEAYERIGALRPDVAVLDIGMPGSTGIEVARRVRDAALKTAVVLVSMHREQAIIEAGLEAGASGYVVKDGAGHELVAAVRAAAAGELYLSPRIAGLVVSGSRPGGGAPGAARVPAELTARERDVLRLLATGLTSKQIARSLGIGAKTVEVHRATIMKKLGINHVPGLVKYAIVHHIATLEG